MHWLYGGGLAQLIASLIESTKLINTLSLIHI